MTDNDLKRFLKYLVFDPGTGCVLWIGGRSTGGRRNVSYGSFHFQGRNWKAHRWAAKYIHGLDISDPDTQVDHFCEPFPNSLCVHHLQVIKGADNRRLVHERRRRSGLTAPPEPFTEIPFYYKPQWLIDAKRRCGVK